MFYLFFADLYLAGELYKLTGIQCSIGFVFFCDDIEDVM